MPPGEEPLLDALERYFRSTTGVVVPREAWDWAQGARAPAPDVPRRRRRRPRAGPRQGPRGAQGAAAAAVRRGDRRGRRRQRARRAPARRRGPSAPSRRRSPRGAPATRSAASRRSSTRARRSGSRSSAPPSEQEARHRLGVRRLLLLDDARRRSRRCSTALDNAEKLGLAGSPYPSVAELLEDCRAAVVAGRRRRAARRCATRRRTTRCAPRPPRDHEAHLRAVMADVIRVLDALAAGREGAQRARRDGDAARAHRHARPARPAGAPRLRRRGRARPQLRRYPTYLAALEQRRERLDPAQRQPGPAADGPDRRPAGRPTCTRSRRCPTGRPPGAHLRQVRWMLEEYRVSLWAQQLGTPYPVSDQRIRKALQPARARRSLTR